jgi:hypothetical protein
MEDQMAYLDVNPMMVALRNTPEEFEVKQGWLYHSPSQHSFKFDPEGHVQIRADCNCAFLAVKAEQEKALFNSFQEWQAVYWRPLEINKEFASHFRPRSAFRQFLIDLTARVHRRLLRQEGVAHHHHEGVMVPAE